MAAGIPIYLKYLVYDPVSGALLCNPLPHPHQSIYEVIAPQAGMPGQVAIGALSIPLFGPGTDQYKWAKVDYDKLKQMARIEAYMTLTPDESPGAAGNPVFSAVITSLSKDLITYQLDGQDSLFLLQTRRSLRTTGMATATDSVFTYFLKGNTLVFGDDYNANSLSNYTNDGGWTVTTFDGMTALLSSFSGDGLLYTTTSWGNANYSDCLIHAPFTTITSNVPGQAAKAEVIAAVADANNYILGSCSVWQIGGNLFRIDANIFQKAAGVFGTPKSSVVGIATTLSNARVQVQLAGYQINLTSYRWTLYINEIDVGCTWIQTVGVGAPTGAIGLRSLKSAEASGETAYAIKNLVFLNKTALFQPGSVGAGTVVVTQALSSITNLDAINLAMTTEKGSTYRKNPKPGLNNDTVDFNHAATSADLTAMVKLEEGVNLTTAGSEPNAERLGTGLVVASAPGPDSAGSIHWYSVAAINKFGLVEDIASLPTYVSGIGLRQAADNVLTNRANPDQAKRLTVIRTMDLLPSTPTPSTLSFREGDKVTLHVPREGMFNQSVTIISAKVTEGSPLVECTADQYPTYLDNYPTLARLVDTVKQLAIGTPAGGMQVIDPTTGFATGVSFNRQAVLPINPWKMEVSQVGGGQNLLTGVFTVIQFDTVNYDDTGNYAANVFTVPLSGVYMITARISADMPAQNGVIQTFFVSVFINGTETKRGQGGLYPQPAAGAAIQNLSSTLTPSIKLIKGDTIDIRGFPTTGGAAATVPASVIGRSTYWSLHLLSG